MPNGCSRWQHFGEDALHRSCRNPQFCGQESGQTGQERGQVGGRKMSDSRIQTDQTHIHLCCKSFTGRDKPGYPFPYRWEHRHQESVTQIWFSPSAFGRAGEPNPKPDLPPKPPCGFPSLSESWIQGKPILLGLEMASPPARTGMGCQGGRAAWDLQSCHGEATSQWGATSPCGAPG